MAEFIALICPSCGGKTQFQPGSDRYLCSYCGNERILQLPREAREAHFGNNVRPDIPRPDCVLVKDGGNALLLQRRWFSWKTIPLAFFCVAWDSFLIFWYSMAFSSGAPWIMVVFPIAHLAVGIGLTYSVLAGFLNRTSIEITPQEFSVIHEPLLWPGEITLKTKDIKQLYTKEVTTRGENGTTHTYELWIVTREEKSRKIMSGVDSPDVALYLEQQVERWLRIEDMPIAGELGRM